MKYANVITYKRLEYIINMCTSAILQTLRLKISNFYRGHMHGEIRVFRLTGLQIVINPKEDKLFLNFKLCVFYADDTLILAKTTDD